MIITIEGTPRSGKSEIARVICKGKKTVFLAEHNFKSPWWSQAIAVDTDFVIIDDVINANMILSRFEGEFLTIDHPVEGSFIVKTPNVIIIKK